MRRFGDLMSELGFNKDAPLDSQKALFRHLVRAANSGPSVPTRLDQNPEPKPVSRSESSGEQLSFDLEILGTSVQKKSAGR